MNPGRRRIIWVAGGLILLVALILLMGYWDGIFPHEGPPLLEGQT